MFLSFSTSLPLFSADEEFVKLTGGKATLSFIKFLGMSDVEDMISCEALSMEEVTEIWYVHCVAYDTAQCSIVRCCIFHCSLL